MQRSGVLLHLRRFDSVTSTLHENLEFQGVMRLRGWWSEQRCLFLITESRGSQRIHCCNGKTSADRQPPQQPVPKLLSDSWSSACCSYIFLLGTVLILSIQAL